MKKLICVLFCVCIAVCHTATAFALEEMPAVSAAAYVLYCPQSGNIILSKNENERKKPASTTKLMTSLLTLEQAAKGNKIVTFEEKMTAEGSSMYLEYGDTVKLDDLAVGMMMCSGNDAANAAAFGISGSAEKFAQLMNSRAQSIGMKNTHFVTPSGLDDDSHYSTAYDMALLMAEVLKNEQLAELISQKSATVNFIHPNNKHMTYKNHNRLLTKYKDCIGGKTGYTDAAGRCLVSAAERDGLTLICVTLDDRNDWDDHIALYDYGFSTLACYRDPQFNVDIPVLGGEEDTVKVCSDSDCELVVPKDKQNDIKRKIKLDSFLFAPVKDGARVGVIEYTLDGKMIRISNVNVQNGVRYKSGKNESLLYRLLHIFDPAVN